MITFGICTNYNHGVMVERVIDSIFETMQYTPDTPFEVIVCGDKYHFRSTVPNIDINRINTGNDSDFTKKKNIITQEAKYDIIVYTHDYVSFNKNWMWGLDFFSHLTPKSMMFSSAAEDWDILMNVIHTQDGRRFRDWCAWDDYRHGHEWTQHEPWCPPEGIRYRGMPCLVPYYYRHTDRMYISGMYWIAKKHVMLDNPLREDLKWGEGEDVEWSLRVRNKYKYKMNTYSSCTLMKPKDVILPYVELTNEK